MNVSPDADQETVRGAYIGIVKIVHPDSGHANASAEKFAEVDNAFRILQEKFSQERHVSTENPDVKDHDITVRQSWSCQTVRKSTKIKKFHSNSIQHHSTDNF